jgi:hypothetical protein
MAAAMLAVSLLIAGEPLIRVFHIRLARAKTAADSRDIPRRRGDRDR